MINSESEELPPEGADASLRFEWPIRALAQDADVQRSLFPAFACVADELALDFEECLRTVVASGRTATFSESEARRVRELDAKLADISGLEHQDLWTDDALRGSRRRDEVRAAARQALIAFGWSSLPPPLGRNIYVGPER